MDRLLQNDLAVKILSVFLAMTIWFLATGERGEIQKPLNEVPVHVRNLSPDLALTDVDPSTVTVTVRGDRQTAEALDRSSVDAFVNLTGSRPGRFGVEVQVSVPVGVTLVDVTPGVVDVVLQSMVEKDVPVDINVVGTPAEDYELGPVSTEVQTVRLRGPESEVARAAQAVGQISVDGAAAPVSAEIRLFPQDEDGNTLNQTVVTPAYITVTVPVTEVRVEKDVSVRAVISGTPADGYSVGNVTTDTETVRVVGAKSVVEALESVQTEEVSVAGASENVIQKVRLALPDGVDRGAPPNVEVTVEIVSD